MPGLRATRFACAADRLFDGRRVLRDHALIVNSGKIGEILPRGSVPEHLPLLSEPDTTIIPGLIDAHTHLMRWELPLFLAYGVTTVRDTGNDLEWILHQRTQAEEGLSPSILCTGPLLDGPWPVHPGEIVSRSCADPASGVAAVRETAEAGTDAIKFYCGLPAEWLPAMAEEAHATGLKVSMHCLGAGVLAAARAGVDEFHHLDGILADVWPDHPPGWLSIWGLPEFSSTLEAQQRVADEIAGYGMAVTPTLAYWESQWRLREIDFSPARDAVAVPPEMVAWQRVLAGDPVPADQWRRALGAAQRFTGLLLERGVTVLAGTDAPCGAITPGLSLWREMSLLAGSGMPPLQALQAATSEAAAFLGCPQRGRLSAGSAADLVIVRGDPTRQIPTEPDIVSVVRNGVLYQPDDLREKTGQAAATVADDPWSAQFRMDCPA